MRSFVAASLAMLMAVSLPASAGWAASNPKAIVVRIKCQLQGVSGTPDNATECHGLNGWFDGRLDWISGGVTLFQELGPFVGLQGGAGEVLIFADGNGDENAFNAIYENPSTSILTAPDLMIRLLVRNHAGQDVPFTEQRYMPVASALWAKHSEDTVQLQADIAGEAQARVAADATLQAALASALDRLSQLETRIDVLQTALNNEAAARQAADTTLQTALNNEAAARQAADTTLQANLDAEAATREAGDAALGAALNNEAAARQAADTTLQANLNAETAARQAADATLLATLDSNEAFHSETEVFGTLPTSSTSIEHLDLDAGKYVVMATVLASNVSSPTAIPVVCSLQGGTSTGVSSGVSLSFFDAVTLPVMLVTELLAPGMVELRCTSNTGPGGATADVFFIQVTAIKVGNITVQP